MLTEPGGMHPIRDKEYALYTTRATRRKIPGCGWSCR